MPLHFLAGMQICHRLSSAAIHKTITYKENAGHFSSDIYTDLRTNQSLLFFFRKEDSMLLSSADTTFRHTRTFTMQLPDLSGPAEPIESSWRFICHGNVFLGKTPTRGEPGWSGQDIVVCSVFKPQDASRCALLCHYPAEHLCVRVFVHTTGDPISEIYGN